MLALLPVDEIQQRLQPPAPAPVEALSPHADPAMFSLPLACSLINLCISAERNADSTIVHDQDGQTFVAFRSQGDPAAVLNVRGQTAIRAVPFAHGSAYGPLVELYRSGREVHRDDLPLDRPVWLTGHGLGAAFALLAAADRLASGHPVGAVYTFGAPRVGDAAFVGGLKCPTYRVVNNLDVVPTMPTSWQWRHAGAHKLINADGTLNSHPNPFNRLSSFTRQTAWLSKLLQQGLSSGFPRSLYTLLDQVIGDHALSAYRDRLQTLRDSQSDAA